METIIDLNDYELSGGGKLGESYIHKTDPNLLLKLYSHQLEELGLSEYESACKVHGLGIPCPTPGEQVRTGDGRLGILYKRAMGKKSYARALSEHPENLQQYAAEFAAMCKLLHSTVPPKGMFTTARNKYKEGILLNPFLKPEEKTDINRFIDTLPDADTALHGDLHYGNVIFTPDGKKYFIDLSDFCTGTPMFDIGILFLQACCVPDEVELELYHITTKVSKAFWKAFIPEYFGPDANQEEVEEMVTPYALLRILQVERLMGYPIEHIRPKLHSLIDNV